MCSLFDLLTTVEEFYMYLTNKNVPFTDQGFPIFERCMFVRNYPQMVVPFDQRNSKLVTCRKKTMLCFYCSDKRIYPRIDRILRDLPVYRQYYGVVGFDLTVTADMDSEWQDLLMLANQLFTAVLAYNEIPIAFNLRTGSELSLKNLSGVPTGVICASGFLGCEKSKSPFDFSYLKKIFAVQPSKLMLYGKHDYTIEKQLSLCGIDFRVYDDFHRLSKEVSVYG